jgi:hypothetical protein
MKIAKSLGIKLLSSPYMRVSNPTGTDEQATELCVKRAPEGGI